MVSKSAANDGARRTRRIERAGAGAVLAAALAAVVWGYDNQAPADPFEPQGWWESLFARLPHPHYALIPVRPMGALRSFVPRELNVDPAAIASDGGAPGDQRFVLTRLIARPDAPTLAAIGADGSVLVSHDTKSWAKVELPRPVPKSVSTAPVDATLMALTGHEGAIESVAFSPDGTRLATASDDGTAGIWDLATGQEILRLPVAKGRVWSVAFSPDGTRIATGDETGLVQLWALDGQPETALSQENGGRVESVAFSPDGRYVASIGLGGVWLLPLDGTPAGQPFPGDPNLGSSVAFSPDVTRIAAGGSNGTIRLADLHTQTPTAGGFRGHNGWVWAVAFSPAGGHIASGGEDGTVRLWTLDGEPAAAPFFGHEGWVKSVAFSPDGMRIASGGYDGLVRLWNADGTPAIEPFIGHEGAIYSVAFSPDGTRLATASDDMTVRVWDLARLAPTLANSSSPPPVALGGTVAPDGALWVVGRHGYVARIDPTNVNDDRLFPTRVDQDLYAIQVLEDDSVFVAGADGIILKTDDRSGTRGEGTEQWQWELSNAPAIYGLLFNSLGEGWAVGDGGLIRHRAAPDKSGLQGAWEQLVDAKGLAGIDNLRLTDIHVQADGLAWAGSDGTFSRPMIFEAKSAANPESWRALEHFTAPWWFLIGLPSLVAVGFLNLRAWRAEPPGAIDSIVGRGTPDRPLGIKDADALNLKPVALGLSQFLRNVNTEPPITIAVSGRWGTGKSSLMNMLREDLRGYGCRPVWFNAWHHGQEEHLLAALLENVRAQALPSWWTLDGLRFRARLFWRRTRRDLYGLAALAFLLAIIASVAVLLTSDAHLNSAAGQFASWLAPSAAEGMPEWVLGLLEPESPARDYGAWGLSGVTMVGLLLWIRQRLTALPANPAKLLSKYASNARIQDFADKLSFRYRFGREFADVCSALQFRSSPGLVILIDDLDRCKPEDVLAVLEAVNYFVTVGACYVILGMDRRQVEHCVGVGFKEVVKGLPDDELVFVAGETKDEAGRQRAFARLYLEKLINIEVPVPSLTEAQAGGLLSGKQEALPEPAAWVASVVTAIRNSYEVARFGVIGVVAGLSCVAIISAIGEPPDPTPVAVAPVPGFEASQGDTSPSEVVAAPAPSLTAPAPDNGPSQEVVQQQSEFHTPGIRIVEPEALKEPWRWLWWGPTLLAMVISILLAIGLALRRQSQTVRDSPAFAAALGIIYPIVYAAQSTPRAIKRFQNRMRYLAVRLNPPAAEIDPVERMLFRVGEWLGRDWVPKSRVFPESAIALSEPKLVLLGAAEAFAPALQQAPVDEFARWLGLGGNSDDRIDETATHALFGSDERFALWDRVRRKFRGDAACTAHWPTKADVMRYRGLVAAAEAPPPSAPPKADATASESLWDNSGQEASDRAPHAAQ